MSHYKDIERRRLYTNNTRVERDCRLVQQKKNILQNIDNVVYVVKGNCRNVSDLQHLSCELHKIIHGDKIRNRIYPKIYRFPDDQIEIRTRVGLCIHASIITHLQLVNDELSVIQHEISLERTVWSRYRDKFISFVKKMLTGENLIVCTSSSNHKIFKDLSKDMLEEISRKKLLGTTLKSYDVAIDRFFQILKENLDKVLLDKMPVLKECQVKRNSKATGKQNIRTTKHLYHREKPLLSEPSGASTSSMTPNGHRCTEKCKLILNKIEKAKAGKGMFTGILKYVSECKDNLSSFSRILSDELTRRGDSVMLHEWKTVSLRNAKVKGFGCMDDTICLYLQHDNDKDKTEVLKYINDFFDDTTLKYNISVEFRCTKITLFTFLQQGSKINPDMSNEGQNKYGTVGMFLEDEKGTYFFTTCAHVIGKNKEAYSNVHNATIGRNVLTRYPHSRKSEEPSLDFSLVQVSPDRTLTCTFGLKTQVGNFVNMQIFRGDPLDVRHRNLYKWGASQPNMQVGTCTGCKYDGRYIYLQVDTKNFAKPGDSGAIICIGDSNHPEQSLAAFVVVGADEESYLVYKVSDALELISAVRKEIKPCISHCTKNIAISSCPPKSVKITTKTETGRPVSANRVQIQQMVIKLQPSSEDFNIKGCSISGEKLLFTDKRNKRIIIHNGAGTHIEDISLSSEPFDIVALDVDTVAVSFGRNKYIEKININTKVVTKIHLRGNCWGLSYDGEYLYAVIDGHGIYVAVVTLAGELIKRIPVSSEFDQTEYITTHGTNVYFSVFIPKNLVSMNLNGSVQWQFQKNIFNQPRGVTSDILGNIFVTGFSSHNLVVVENNGRDCSELLNKGRGLHYPTSIYFDKTKHRLLVSGYSGGSNPRQSTADSNMSLKSVSTVNNNNNIANTEKHDLNSARRTSNDDLNKQNNKNLNRQGTYTSTKSLNPLKTPPIQSREISTVSAETVSSSHSSVSYGGDPAKPQGKMKGGSIADTRKRIANILGRKS
ncbi:unnamed protein product [Mytilus coruscus]|uniref:Uncharacterized protein n=1 Tax=Mytilus coruscus TaxID=42192 RepID=A0A6J8AIY9_MYTCO|nr:unnamed protein product [Mytilus coruscus]